MKRSGEEAAGLSWVSWKWRNCLAGGGDEVLREKIEECKDFTQKGRDAD